MNKRSLREEEVRGRRVLVRVDFNVPLDKATGAVTDDTRLRAHLPTIQYLRDKGARVILCSHLGRPEGQVVERLRLAPVARRLSELLGVSVSTVPDCIGPQVGEAAHRLQPEEVLLLENLRFHPEEERNDPSFAQALARMGELYVYDAFGAAHRAHASTAAIAAYLPVVAGFLMEKELSVLGKALANPNRPFAAILGGAKVSDKIAVLANLLSKVDLLLIGGGMACTFLKAQGYEMGQSLVETDRLEVAQRIMQAAQERALELLLPQDLVVADRFDAEAAAQVVAVGDVPQTWRALDIGPQTVEHFGQALRKAKTVLWNGPMGVFEFPRFAAGTKAIATLLARLEATTIVGGGETAAAVEQAGVADQITHISTGGGATLEFLEGKTLPGVAAISDR